MTASLDGAAAISVQRVSMVFNQGKPSELAALREIDLEVAPGEFVSLIGPSGCGKSTLLRLVGDLLAPTTGTVEVNGRPAKEARLGRDYGMAFQQATLLQWRKVLGNIELPLEIMDVPRQERERRSPVAVAIGQAGAVRRPLPWQLSGGMQQRVAIARALAANPSLLPDGRALRRPRRDGAERMQMELMRIWQEPRPPCSSSPIPYTRGGLPLQQGGGPLGAARPDRGEGSRGPGPTSGVRHPGRAPLLPSCSPRCVNCCAVSSRACRCESASRSQRPSQDRSRPRPLAAGEWRCSSSG